MDWIETLDWLSRLLLFGGDVVFLFQVFVHLGFGSGFRATLATEKTLTRNCHWDMWLLLDRHHLRLLPSLLPSLVLPFAFKIALWSFWFAQLLDPSQAAFLLVFPLLRFDPKEATRDAQLSPKGPP